MHVDSRDSLQDKEGLIFETESAIGLKFTNSLGYLANHPQGPAISPVLGLHMYVAMLGFLFYGFRDQMQFLILHEKHFAELTVSPAPIPCCVSSFL